MFLGIVLFFDGGLLALGNVRASSQNLILQVEAHSFRCTLELPTIVSIPLLRLQINVSRRSIAALPRRPHSDHWPTKDVLLLRA